jgi:hypothetical protein
VGNRHTRTGEEVFGLVRADRLRAASSDVFDEG